MVTILPRDAPLPKKISKVRPMLTDQLYLVKFDPASQNYIMVELYKVPGYRYILENVVGNRYSDGHWKFSTKNMLDRKSDMMGKKLKASAAIVSSFLSHELVSALDVYIYLICLIRSKLMEV